MNGIISGKIEKNPDCIEWKTIESLPIPSTRNFTFDGYSGLLSPTNYVKFVSNEKYNDGIKATTIFMLGGIGSEDYGWAFWYATYSNQVQILYNPSRHTLEIHSRNQINFTQLFASIELGTISGTLS